MILKKQKVSLDPIKEHLVLNEEDMLMEKQGRKMLTQVSWLRKVANGGINYPGK